MRLMGLGLCAVALLAATGAQAEDDFDFSTWYLKAETGWSFGAETEIEGPVSTTFDTEDDLVIGGSVGRTFANNWRAEIEGSYQNNDTDAAGNAFILGEEINVLTVMPVVYYDFDLNSRFTPFIGAGFGGARIDADYSVLSPPDEFRTDDAQWTYAWQATAGVSYDISDHIAVDARYRYLQTGNYDVGSAEADFANHAVLAGVRFKFGGGRPAKAVPAYTPEPAPIPEPEPVVEPEVQEVIVYFRFDEAKITPEAAEVLDEAARVIRERGVDKVKVVGYTDTSGPAKYNLWLSESRAQAVRGALVQRGVEASVITVDYKGEDEPRIPTGDGVKNAENRRSEVAIYFVD